MKVEELILMIDDSLEHLSEGRTMMSVNEAQDVLLDLRLYLMEETDERKEADGKLSQGTPALAGAGEGAG